VDPQRFSAAGGSRGRRRRRIHVAVDARPALGARQEVVVYVRGVAREHYAAGGFRDGRNQSDMELVVAVVGCVVAMGYAGGVQIGRVEIQHGIGGVPPLNQSESIDVLDLYVPDPCCHGSQSDIHSAAKGHGLGGVLPGVRRGEAGSRGSRSVETCACSDEEPTGTLDGVTPRVGVAALEVLDPRVWRQLERAYEVVVLVAKYPPEVHDLAVEVVYDLVG